MKKITQMRTRPDQDDRRGPSVTSSHGAASSAVVDLDAAAENDGGVSTLLPGGDDLGQVRELLFGSTVRDLEAQRRKLQDETSEIFDETDRRTSARLDEIDERLDLLKEALDAETAVRLAVTARLQRLSEENRSLITGLDKRGKAESARLDARLETLGALGERRDAEQRAALERSVADERRRVAEALRAMAETLSRESA